MDPFDLQGLDMIPLGRLAPSQIGLRSLAILAPIRITSPSLGFMICIDALFGVNKFLAKNACANFSSSHIVLQKRNVFWSYWSCR